MSKVPIRAECCQTCSHWNCSSRSVVGDPPDQVETYCDYNSCSLCGSMKEWREWCGSYENFRWIRNTYRPDPQTMRTSSEIFTDSVVEYLRDGSSSSLPISSQKSIRSCPCCGGSGRATCWSCDGSGYVKCSHCDGEGGFLTKFEVRENYERFTKHFYWMPDAALDLKFYGIGDDGWGPGTIDSFDEQHVICKKDVEIAFNDEPKRHTKDALGVGDSSFVFPETMSESFRGRITDKFESLCESIDDEAEKWDGDSWSPNFRIKDASVSVKQTPCIVRVAFKDAYGFSYRALVNLANNKVHLYDVDEEDAAEVMAALKEKANAGDIDLQNDIGQMYAHYPKFSKVVPKDYEKAVEWFLKAARAGHADAMDNLGNCCKDGEGVAEDKELAVAWHQKAAKKGLPWGQYHFAKCLLNGTGIDEDDELALHWYLKAARQGLADAQNMVARCAEEGWGMKEDADIAFFWMTRAAEGGHATAMNNLAIFYKKGYGCEKDSEKESEWRKKAEENGYVRKTDSGW